MKTPRPAQRPVLLRSQCPVPFRSRPRLCLLLFPFLLGLLVPTMAGAQGALEARVRIKAVGDIMLARSIGRRIAKEGWRSVFEAGEKSLSGADILVANLECCISTRGKPQIKSYTFRANPGAATALANAGFSLVSLANNHAMDYGPEALAETIALLDALGIAHVGAGPNLAEARRPAILSRGGLRLAFLGYASVAVESGGFDIRSWKATAERPGLALAIPADIRADVGSALRQADAVIVLLHAGQEGSAARTRVQEEAARTAIDAGAILVIGSHAHVAQELAVYGSGRIAYGLGNWIFDGFGEIGDSGAVLDATIQAFVPENGASLPKAVTGPPTRPVAVPAAKARVISASLIPRPWK